MILLKTEKLVPKLSHQKIKRLRQELAYQLKNDAELIGNDDSGSYGLNTLAGRIKINVRELQSQDIGQIDDILELLPQNTERRFQQQ